MLSAATILSCVLLFFASMPQTTTASAVGSVGQRAGWSGGMGGGASGVRRLCADVHEGASGAWAYGGYSTASSSECVDEWDMHAPSSYVPLKGGGQGVYTNAQEHQHPYLATCISLTILFLVGWGMIEAVIFLEGE
jgi:hypothetical protein